MKNLVLAIGLASVSLLGCHQPVAPVNPEGSSGIESGSATELRSAAVTFQQFGDGGRFERAYEIGDSKIERFKTELQALDKLEPFELGRMVPGGTSRIILIRGEGVSKNYSVNFAPLNQLSERSAEKLEVFENLWNRESATR